MASRYSKYLFCSVIIFFWMMPGYRLKGQPLVTVHINQEPKLISTQSQLWFIDKTGQLSFEAISTQRFAVYDPNHSSLPGSSWAAWSKLKLQNLSGTDQEYILQTNKWGSFEAFVVNSALPVLRLKSGSLLPLNKRSQPSNINAVRLLLQQGESKTVFLQFKPVYSIYARKDISMAISEQNLFEKADRQRLLWQGLFFGIILVMALYNLFILFAVKDISYFHYVLSILSIGLYFAFYYGFGIEYLWPRSPLWDTFCFAVINPFTGLTRILFTRTYLHTPQLLPRINKVLNMLGAACIITMLTGLACYAMQLDILKPLVTIIGILGALVLIMMFVAGFVAYYYDHYEPAKYFIAANILLIIGAIAFILRETGFMSDNFFTRYLVQYAVLIQAVVLSLGLASRLNRMRLQLTTETLEKERLALEREKEKKELIQHQKLELQQQVQEKTTDLHLKNTLLEETVNQLKESEHKLSELNQVKDKLFSVVSHDLRNPLATMQSFLKLITDHEEKLNEEERKKLFFEAQQSLNNMNELLYNLLQWSKSQMNLLRFRPDKINVKTVIEAATRLVQLHAHMKQVEIKTTIPDGLHAFADKDMIEFVIRNLLSNAIKFSQRNSIVTITAFSKDDLVNISITDSGIGLSEPKRKKLLEKNTTISRRGTEKEKGTGLGLLISKEFIEKNQGQLQIESVAGKGSVFGFALPLHQQKLVLENLDVIS
jgi:signal transduction histidine kinase